MMTYDDEIISFSRSSLFGRNVTVHHRISLVVTQNRHNFRHIQTRDKTPRIGLSMFYLKIICRCRENVDAFASFFVLPQANHGLMGTHYSVNGDGKFIGVEALPTRFDRFKLLVEWVEKGNVPPMSVTVTGGNRSLLMCAYPKYPKYKGGAVEKADAYECAML